MSTATLSEESFWQRSKKKIPLLGRIAKPNPESNGTAVTPEDQADAAKAAHARRREQVRRAQRNHRARKEDYIKTLERQFRMLRGEEDSISLETQKVLDENQMLREIMIAKGISFPGKTQPPSSLSRSPNTVVRVVGDPGHDQRLQVSVGGSSLDAPRIFPPDSASPVIKMSPSDSALSSTGSPPDHPEISTDLGGGFNHYDNSTSLPVTMKHPYGLDATQVGVDFVLFLERHCLQHARSSCAKAPFSGHVLTFQTSLLANGPDKLHDNDTWEIPAFHLDRLFDLAGALNLDGDITPVQAWNRIKHHPLFQKLDPDTFRRLAVLLREEVQCFGFGAVIDEELFNFYLNQTFLSL